MADPSGVLVRGPLGEFAEGFLAELARVGYAARSREPHLHLMRHLSGWLGTQGLTAGDLSAEVVEAFVAARRPVYATLRSPRALVPLLEYLRSLGVEPMATSVAPVAPGEVLLERFGRYLSTERGLAPATVRSYRSQVRPFLARHDESEWALLSARQLNAFLAKRAVGQRPRSVQVGANALRALLRWMWREQIVSSPLADTIGPFAARTGTQLPKALSEEELDDLLAALPPDGPARMRNEAMLALMRRLALRAGEVASLRLDDINWRHGVIVVRGKRGRRHEMPLPVDVGKLLTTYLRHGRPTGGSHREVFLALDAPHGPLMASAVASVVSRALARAGISGPGAAHRLRHSAACRVLAAGGGLIEAGQLLRNSTAEATAIYAKSDLAALAVLARPWPTGATR